MPGALFGLPGSPPPSCCKFLYEVSRINISAADIDRWNQQGGKFSPAGGGRWADNGLPIVPRCLVQNLRDAPHDARRAPRESQVT